MPALKTLFDPATAEAYAKRIEGMQTNNMRLWGTMDAAQMLAHCSIGLEIALGDLKPPRSLFGRLVGWLAKGKLTDGKPYERNLPTDPSLLTVGKVYIKDFEREKVRLLALLKRLAAAGPEGMTRHPHPFFGQVSPEVWGISQCKHLEHHLSQFSA